MSALQFRGAVSQDEVSAAYELAARVFGPSYFEARAVKDRILRVEPPAEPADVVIATTGSEVVGVVRIVDREVSLGPAVLKVGGITSVAVRPDYRGSGCGRLVMEAAIERSRARRDVLSIAFARRAVDGFYWRLGYVGLGAFPRMVCTVKPGIGGPDADTAEGWRDEWLDALGAAYEETYSHQPFRFVRSREWWRSARERFAWLAAGDVISIHERGACIGYYVLDGGVVIELAAAAGRLDHVVSAMLRREAHAGELTLALSPAHPAVAHLGSLNHTYSLRRAWDGGHVLRVLDAGPVLAALGDRVCAEERQAWQADLRRHPDACAALTAAAKGSLAVPPVWSKLDEF